MHDVIEIRIFYYIRCYRNRIYIVITNKPNRAKRNILLISNCLLSYNDRSSFSLSVIMEIVKSNLTGFAKDVTMLYNLTTNEIQLNRRRQYYRLNKLKFCHCFHYKFCTKFQTVTQMNDVFDRVGQIFIRNFALALFAKPNGINL